MSQIPSNTPTTDDSAGSRAAVESRLDRLPVTSRHRRITAVLAAGTFFDAFDALVLGVALTVIATSLGQGFLGTGLLISAGYVGQALGALFLGSLSERFGRKAVFLVSVTVFSLLSVACALAWNLESLAAARLVQGLGLGAEVPIAATLISEFAPARRRGRSVMLYQSVFAWGVLAAPLAGLGVFALVGPELGWRVLFAFGALPLLIVLVARRVLPESVRWLTATGRVQEADAIVSEFESTARREGHRLATPRPAGERGAGASQLREIFGPEYRLRTLLNGTLWFTTYFVAYGYSVWLPSLYVTIGGLAVHQALALTVVVGVAQLGVVYGVALSVDRIGRKPLLVGGYTVAVLGAATGIAMVAAGATQWPTLFVAGFLLATGAYIPAAALYLYVPELYPTRIRAWGTSAGTSMNRLASVLAPTIVGALLAAGLGLAAVFALFAVVLVIGLGALLAWGVETAGRPLEETARTAG